MMGKDKFIKMMETKLTYGDTISNEDIMRGILMILQSNATETYQSQLIKREDFNAKAIAKAFYNAHKTQSSSRIADVAGQLKSELSTIQFTEVISEISEIDDNFLVREMVSVMSRVL